ncbi:hypothetical protein [Nevskia sp.]|uniref:hypothetical protein n=1 Tax=Nevskia sp. TaxID=1929292 RepID=UPI0025FBA4E3|nr:hypothetical protein [Nevskia sp.]
MSKLTAKQRQELEALAAQPDDQIDTSDAPEIQDWSNAERGRFYHKDAVKQIPIYLDADVMEFLADRAERRKIDTSTLANELLKKNVELIMAAEA